MSRCRGPIFLLSLALAAAAPVASPAAEVPLDFARQVKPLFAKYCINCHGAAKKRGGLTLDGYTDEAAALKDHKVWDKVLEQVRAREMPPQSRQLQPTQAEREVIVRWITGLLARTRGTNDPGRVTLRRLNRAEYNNTVRDLVGIDFKPADDFPMDDVGYGFDNIGDVLSLPPVLLEKYLAAAEHITERAFQSPEARKRILLPGDAVRRNRDERARRILESFVRRAYRRPVTAEEVDRLVYFAKLTQEDGGTFDKGIELALQAVLVSPHFLFHVELDPRPNDPNDVHFLNDYELASRLSYFLWSSMPDDQLFDLAGKGELRKKETLQAQVRRMLGDPKAKALVENFAGQWLQLRNLKTATPDPGLFPGFDDGLRSAMQRETELFFEAVVKEDRSVLDFLDADFTFVNERLARHYGIPGVKGDEFRRVPLTGGQRGGVLTQASVLTVTSNPTRTSPVKRGKWILENILGTPPPPPPPDAGELSEDKNVVQSGSLRKRMEQHRANPNCAVCHQSMDPLGFGLENFDAVGAWRTKDGNFEIDPAGVLPDGRSFHSPRDLKAILKGQKELFARCLAEKLLTYALGRGVEYYDQKALDNICAALAKGDDKFSALVLAVVQSDPFLKRRGYQGKP